MVGCHLNSKACPMTVNRKLANTKKDGKQGKGGKREVREE